MSSKDCVSSTPLTHSKLASVKPGSGQSHRQDRGKANEPHTPTNARRVPAKMIRRRGSFSVTNATRKEAKVTYIRLNTQTPCPPRGTVPVNQGRDWEIFHSVPSGSPSVMDATAPAMSVIRVRPALACQRTKRHTPNSQHPLRCWATSVSRWDQGP